MRIRQHQRIDAEFCDLKVNAPKFFGFRFAGWWRPMVSIDVSTVDTSPLASSFARVFVPVVGDTPASFDARRADMVGLALNSFSSSSILCAAVRCRRLMLALTT